MPVTKKNGGPLKVEFYEDDEEEEYISPSISSKDGSSEDEDFNAGGRGRGGGGGVKRKASRIPVPARGKKKVAAAKSDKPIPGPTPTPTISPPSSARKPLNPQDGKSSATPIQVKQPYKIPKKFVPPQPQPAKPPPTASSSVVKPKPKPSPTPGNSKSNSYGSGGAVNGGKRINGGNAGRVSKENPPVVRMVDLFEGLAELKAKHQVVSTTTKQVQVSAPPRSHPGPSSTAKATSNPTANHNHPTEIRSSTPSYQPHLSPAASDLGSSSISIQHKPTFPQAQQQNPQTTTKPRKTIVPSSTPASRPHENDSPLTSPNPALPPWSETLFAGKTNFLTHVEQVKLITKSDAAFFESTIDPSIHHQICREEDNSLLSFEEMLRRGMEIYGPDPEDPENNIYCGIHGWCEHDDCLAEKVVQEVEVALPEVAPDDETSPYCVECLQVGIYVFATTDHVIKKHVLAMPVINPNPSPTQAIIPQGNEDATSQFGDPDEKICVDCLWDRGLSLFCDWDHMCEYHQSASTRLKMQESSSEEVNATPHDERPERSTARSVERVVLDWIESSSLDPAFLDPNE